MEDTQKVVETKTEIATTQHEVDYEALIAEKDAALAKVSEEKENYRKGMLKAKGKLPGDSMDTEKPEDWKDEMRRIAREEYLQTQEAQLTFEKEAAYKAALKQNKEYKLALQNRNQITHTSAGGSNEDKPEVKSDSYLSKEQLQALKAKGWSDAKIEAAKKNMKKGSEMPR